MASEPPPPKVTRAQPRRADYIAARAGSLPAEALRQVDRWRLVAEFHRLGWTDADIAGHTRQTVYTVSRIRAGMGLKPNRGDTNDR